MRRRAARTLSVVLVTVVSGCATAGPSTTADHPAQGAARAQDKRTVATTVAPVTDIVRQVVGDRATVVGLIPEGVDSHTFEPSPRTAKALTGADVLFMNGLHLEGSTLSQARATIRKGSQIVALGDLTLAPGDYAFDLTFPKEKGDPNPHVWMDPLYARRWSEIVRDTMVGRDPANAGYYRANQARFAGTVEQLDSAIRQSVESIPRARRKLLTYHDSFAYFSRRYDLPVVGAVQPSDFSEPSPREIESLVDQVRAERVPAVFGSEVFPSKVLEQVASQSGARFVNEVRDDQLPGRPGDPEHTYVGMLVDDVTVITRSLGGNPDPMKAVPTAGTWSR